MCLLEEEKKRRRRFLLPVTMLLITAYLHSVKAFYLQCSANVYTVTQLPDHVNRVHTFAINQWLWKPRVEHGCVLALSAPATELETL